MSEQPNPKPLYNPRPQEEVKLPPMVNRPYEQSSGLLPKGTSQTPAGLEGALSNIRI